MDPNTQLTNLGKKLGYFPDTLRGVCYGVTLAWLEACMLHEEDKFNLRLTKMLNENASLPGHINQIKDTVKSGKEITEDEVELLEILSFYEKVTLNQQPHVHDDFFNAALNQHENVEQIMNFTASDKMSTGGGVKVVNSQLGLYLTPKDVADYLEKIAKSIDEVGYDPESQAIIGFVLSNENHTVGLNYNPVLRQWSFMNINKGQSKTFDPSQYGELAKYIVKGFGEGTVGFSTTVITKANDNNIDLLTAKLNDSMPQRVTMPINPSEGDKIRWVHGAAETGLVHFAAAMGRTDIIEELSDSGVSLDSRLNKGHSPAHIAVLNSSVESIETLAKCGASLDLGNLNGDTPAHLAAQGGNDQMIQFLAEQNPEFISKQNNDGRTPAHLSALNGDLHMIEAFARADVSLLSALTSSGLTPAHIAAQNGDLEFLKELAQYSVPLDSLGVAGITPLFLAIQNGHTEIVRYLFEECGLKKNKYTASASSLLNWAKSSGLGDEVCCKMEALINLPGQDPENITVTPDQIAFITYRTESLDILRSPQEHDFLNVLDKLTQKEKELRSRGHIKTAKIMEELHARLTAELLKYYDGEPTNEKYNTFQESCCSAIHAARPQLARHRNLSAYLVLGLFDTDSKKLAKEVEQNINTMNPANKNSTSSVVPDYKNCLRDMKTVRDERIADSDTPSPNGSAPPRA